MEFLPRLGLGTICIVPFMEGFIYYQSTCPEFRCRDGKVLGTQPHLTHRSASTQCVLRLNLIKDILNIVILNSHTHQHTSRNQHGIFIPNPSIHKSWHRNKHKPRAKTSWQIQTSMLFKQKHSRETLTSSISQTYKHSIKALNKCAHHVSHPNACSCECMPYLTYLTTPQHLYINPWSYHMHVYGIPQKEKKP